jgi:hypothetical protein
MVRDKDAVLANYHHPSDFIKTYRTLGAPVVQPQPAPQTPPAPQPQPAPAVPIRIIIVDTQERNPQVGIFRAAQTGWHQAINGFQRPMLWAPASAQQETNWAEWQPHLTEVGLWQVWAFIPGNNATTTYARYRVVHLDGQIEVAVNQVGNRNQWVLLGTYRFGPGRGYVRLSNVTGEMTQNAPPMVGFDAVCWYRPS